MFNSKKLAILVMCLMIAPLVLAACGPTPEPQVIVETVVVEQTKVVEVAGTPEVIVETVQVEVTVPPPEPTPVPEVGAGPYRIALFEDPVTLNYWNYLGPGSSVWTSYVLSGQAPALYTLSDQKFQFVPSLAKDLPPSPEQEGDFLTATIEMVEGATWSDGQPITAQDFVFVMDACRDLKLTHNWPTYCYPDVLDRTEAVGDYAVKFYFTEPVGLGKYQMGVLLAPILPKHFWEPVMQEAYAFVEGLEEPTVEMPEGVDCNAEELSEEDQGKCKDYLEAWGPYNEAIENARRTLYEADGTGAPSGGGYVTDKLELGAFAQRTENADYFFAESTVEEWDDGTWKLTLPDGTTWQAYGEGTGTKTLDFVGGPYAPNIIFSIYGSQDAAFLALADGEVDYVLNPLGLGKGLEEQAMKGEGIKAYRNADYGMYYVAFNMREYPQSLPEFRQAVDIVLDKEFVTDKVLGGVVYPMYSTMPPGNGYWYNPDIVSPYVGWSREDRVNEAVRVLKEAGWTWETEPAWNADTVDVDPGVGIKMPNGEPMSEMVILGPGPAYDPLRATFNQWISEWMRELGMPVRSELTGFNTILGPVFVDADFDMYILGWSLGNVAYPDYFYSFWHSSQDTAVTGNNNTPGYNNPEYDAVIDDFLATDSLDKAREDIFKAQELLFNDRPYICLFYKQTVDLARDNIIFPYTEVLGGIEQAAGFQTDANPLAR